MEMEDWIESMREGELIVIDEAGGSTISQGQGEDLSDTENLTESITVEGYMLINQGRVSSEGKETEVSGVGVGDLTDDFIMVADESRVSEGLDTHKAKGEALLTTELVGQGFDKNREMIWSWLMNDEVSSIGIYGMGAVGKTSLATHIHNQLLQTPTSFKCVFWITVDVNMCKLVLTTRSLGVCRQMGCQERINAELLTKEEAWNLFKEKLGHDAALSPEVEQMAKLVAAECACLPLGIITMAGSMRGVDDLCEWRNALTELKQSEVRPHDMEPEVFHILRFSYTHLNDSALQQCLLYCALFPEDFTMDREDLIGYLIDEGIIQPMNSRQAEFDRGQAMLNNLENACLLQGYISKENYRCFKMHDLIRDLALQKLRENSPVMVEVRKRLKELPGKDEWKEDLVRVSLMENHLNEIPSSCSPMCPKLSTLFLNSNIELEMIADSFFKHLQGLRVLDLSCTAIQKLPGSFSDLVNLIALYLRRCEKLRHIPSLAKLRELRKLDLRYTALEELPQGMEMLSNLRYLNLHGNSLKELPAGILPHLSRLKFLSVNREMGFLKTERVEEVACLERLETLRYQFCDLSDFKKYLKCPEARQPLITYFFLIGQLGVDPTMDYLLYMTPDEVFYKEVLVNNCNIGEKGRFLELPEDISALSIGRCHDARSLCDVSPFKHAPSLKSFVMWECDRIECLVSMSKSSPDIFERLESLYLKTLKNYCALVTREGSAAPPLQSNSTFVHLKSLTIGGCPSMKNLFSLDLLPNLKNLEVIEVHDCHKMEEIIAVEGEGGVIFDDGNSSSSSYTVTNLSKLRALKLSNLPELKSIFHGVVICGSLQEILVVNCPKLKRIPLSDPVIGIGQAPLRRIQAYPKEWWERVVWGDSNSKNGLQSLCVFQEALYY